MSIIYYYTKNENLPIFLKYGIRLSKNFDKEIYINGYKKPYLIGLFNPKDDINKYDSKNYTCIKLDVLSNHCKVINLDGNEFLDEMIKHIPLEEYKFGTFKNPCVLIDTSIMSDKISLYNKIIDIPLLYDNSEDFYYELAVSKILDALSPKEAYELLTKKKK